jgi:hypothetical protein
VSHAKNRTTPRQRRGAVRLRVSSRYVAMERHSFVMAGAALLVGGGASIPCCALGALIIAAEDERVRAYRDIGPPIFKNG